MSDIRKAILEAELLECRHEKKTIEELLGCRYNMRQTVRGVARIGSDDDQRR